MAAPQAGPVEPERTPPSSAAGVRGTSGTFAADVIVQGLLDAATDGVALVDADGRLLFVNSPLEQLFGYGPGQLVGQQVEVLIPDHSRAAAAAERRTFAAEPSSRMTAPDLRLVGRRCDGSALPIEIRLAPLVTDASAYTVASVRDDPRRHNHDGRAASVIEEDSRIATALADSVIRHLFAAGLRTQSVLSRAGDGFQDELTEVVDDLDRIILEIRDVVFGLEPHLRSPGDNGDRAAATADPG